MYIFIQQLTYSFKKYSNRSTQKTVNGRKPDIEMEGSPTEDIVEVLPGGDRYTAPTSKTE